MHCFCCITELHAYRVLCGRLIWLIVNFTSHILLYHVTFCKAFCMFVIFLKPFSSIFHSNKCSSSQWPWLTPSSTKTFPHTQCPNHIHTASHCNTDTRYSNYTFSLYLSIRLLRYKALRTAGLQEQAKSITIQYAYSGKFISAPTKVCNIKYIFTIWYFRNHTELQFYNFNCIFLCYEMLQQQKATVILC